MNVAGISKDNLGCFVFLVTILAKLIALTVWWLSTDTDGKDAMNYVHNQNEGKDYTYMFSIEIRFVNR